MNSPIDFWERRKAAVRAEEKAERRVEQAKQDAREQEELEARPDEEILAKLDLPDPDTLKEGDDFSAFMSKAVPERLRRRALRKLWLSNPVLANLDELVDYGEDFTDASLVVDNLQTTYQVGKGMLAHIQAQADETADPEEEEMAEEASPEGQSAEPARLEPVRETADSEAVPQNQGETVESETAEPAGVRRRMRFTSSSEEEAG